MYVFPIAVAKEKRKRLESSTGVRIFGRNELTGALRERGFTELEQRLSGLAQFVGATKR